MNASRILARLTEKLTQIGALEAGQSADLVLTLEHARIAIEVVPPGESAHETTLRLRHFFDAGAHEAWIIDPQDRTVALWVTPALPLIMSEEDDISSRLLPKFRMPVSELFD